MIQVRGVLTNWLKHASWRARISVVGVAAMLAVVVIKAVSGEPEIALVIGEPYEDMRKRSSASIGPLVPGRTWFNIPRSDARLRFIDPQYGFVTPLARFFTVGFGRDERIDGVRISPQIEPLLLDDTLNLILDLQEQWRQNNLAVSNTCCSNERPANGCKTLGNLERMRVPLPAANITTFNINQSSLINKISPNELSIITLIFYQNSIKKNY